MISRIPMKCLACQHHIAARIQVGHEVDQYIASVCPSCFTPFRLRLLLDSPPSVRTEFVENCAPISRDAPVGTVVNIGSGFVIPRSKRYEDGYFPSFDMPRPTEAEIEEVYGPLDELKNREGQGPIPIDKTVVLGGLPEAREVWRAIRNAYRFHRTEQPERCRDTLERLVGQKLPEGFSIEQLLVGFITRILRPYGHDDLALALSELAKMRANEKEAQRLIEDFAPLKWERLDEKVDVLDLFFRGFDEFNQVFLYVRRKIDMPEEPYAPSTDFEHTRMYYGEAFEVLASHLDVLAAANNILCGRPFDQLDKITLKKYRCSDNGVRSATFANNPVLAELVAEYSNDIRNASHHRWLRLSHDRSVLTFLKGGKGERISLSYAEYLWRCCRITRQLMLLLAIEVVMFEDED